jgi:hypothetical protein
MTVAVALDQKRAALKYANDIRAWRKHLKADLKARRVLLADVLLSDAPWVQTMRVKDLLRATPWIGKHKAERILLHFNIGPRQVVDNVSRAKRRQVLDYIAETFPRVPLGWKGALHD